MRKTLTDDKARELWESNMGLAEASVAGHTSHQTLKATWIRLYGEEACRARRAHIKGRAVAGKSHPTYGLSLEEHWSHNPGLRYITTQGYVAIHAPEWYTGWKLNQRYALEHSIVYCEHNGLTEIPPGHIVHHRNEDKQDNAPENLELLTRSSHAKLHGLGTTLRGRCND